MVGAVFSRTSKKEESLIYGAQFGTSATYKIPMPIKADGSLNYWGLTLHAGGPLYDYFSLPASMDFFDTQYLTAPLDVIKMVQGIDIAADFTEPYPHSYPYPNNNTNMGDRG